jgi:hypothetical protein
MSRLSRIELLVFIACFFAFAWFNQGGGWNQNARFAEVRAIVEEGRFAIDNYLVYKKAPDGQTLERLKLDHAEFTYEAKRQRLCWVDMEWTLYPIGDHPLEPGVEKAPMVTLCCSGDIGYVPADGHFHPNKPPGTQLLAVPGYFLIYHIERALGINPDHWWYLSFNAWLTSVLSVGLISALGCVLFFRLARELGGGATLPALLATFTFAFGTTFFPFATLLFDHNLTASLFVAAYYCLRRTVAGGDGAAAPRPLTMAYLAGFCCGLAVLTNYPAGLGVIALGFYAWLKGGINFRRALAFCAGGIGPALVLALYSWVCYGSPFKLSNDFQSPLFRDDNALFGMFVIPQTDKDWWRVFWVFKVLLYSPFRGVFFFAPVLLMSFGGLVLWCRKREWGDAALCFSVFALFFVMNTFFNGFHAGFSAGPRYLVPGIAFLALPLVAAFRKWPRLTAALAVYSLAINLLLTATDAENPVGVGSHARVPGTEDDITYNLVADYAWPLFVYGEARPLLERQRAVRQQYVKGMEKLQAAIDDPATDADERARREQELGKVQRDIDSLDRDLNGLLTVRGPVSVNPVGVFEGMFEYDFFPAGSPPTRWASFNVGEFLWPDSRWSLLPLLVVSGGLAALGIVLARREGGVE